jgi:1-acyl-sn-glycerol-3-phosphate acyltransferase
MSRILTFLYSVWVGVIFTSSMIVLLPFIVLPITISQRWGGLSFLMLRTWALFFSIFNRIQYKVNGKTHIQKGEAYIYTCNHSSLLDSPAIPISIPGVVKILAKKELVKVPVLGWIIKAVVVQVDRSNNESRRKSIDMLKKEIANGTSIFIFPEGTMNRTGKVLNEFYDGAFRIAIETETPILPMSLINSGNLMKPGKLLVKPGTITVEFAEPIETKGLTKEDIPALKQKVFSIMEKNILRNQKEKEIFVNQNELVVN